MFVLFTLFTFLLIICSLLCREICIIDIGDIEPENFFSNTSQYTYETIPFENYPDYIANKNYTNIVVDCDISNPNISIKYVLNSFDENSKTNFIKMIDILNIRELKFQRDFLKFSMGETINMYSMLSFFYNLRFNRDKYMLEDEESSSQLVDPHIQPPQKRWDLSWVFESPAEWDISWVFEKSFGVVLWFLPTEITRNRTTIVKYGDEVPNKNWIFKAYEKVLMDKEDLVYEKIQHRLDVINNMNTTSVFDVYANNLQEYFGFYNFDSTGKRSALNLQDAVYNGIIKLANNETLFVDIINKIVHEFRKLPDIVIPFINYSYNFYTRFVYDDRWVKIKNKIGYIYSISSSQITGLKHAVYNMDFTIERVDIMNKKLENMFKQLRLSRYIFGQTHTHLQHTNYLRYDNLPEYGSEEEYVLEVQDLFDLDFWNPAKGWFKGFAPGDKNLMRPLNYMSWTFVPIPFIFVPADALSLFGWGWRWVLRSNTTIRFLPFLEDLYEAPDETLCLPPFPYLPDPLWGCRPPFINFLPGVIPADKTVDFFQPFICKDWYLPHQFIEGLSQIIFSRNLGKLIAKNSFLTWVVDIIPLKLVSTEKLPYQIGLCIVPRIPLFIPIFLLGLYIVGAISITFITDLSAALVGMGGIAGGGGNGSEDAVEELKQEILVLQKKMYIVTLILLYKEKMKKKK